MKGSTRLVLVALIAIILAVPGTVSAWSTQGGETLSRSENAVEAGAGFPWALQTGYHIPLTNNFEVIPNFGLYYGRATEVPLVGNILSAQLKFRFLRSGNIHLAIIADPGFITKYYPHDYEFGVQLGLPQLMGTYNVSNVFAVHLGLRMPTGIMFARKTVKEVHRDTNHGLVVKEKTETQVLGLIPILAHFGMEYSASSSVNIFAAMELGVMVAAASGGSDARFYPAFILGAAFKF